MADVPVTRLVRYGPLGQRQVLKVDTYHYAQDQAAFVRKGWRIDGEYRAPNPGTEEEQEQHRRETDEQLRRTRDPGEVDRRGDEKGAFDARAIGGNIVTGDAPAPRSPGPDAGEGTGGGGAAPATPEASPHASPPPPAPAPRDRKSRRR